MDREEYIQQEQVKNAQAFTSTLLFVAALGILLLSILDLFVFPEQFRKFLIYRLIATTLHLLLYVVHRKIQKYHLWFIGIAALIVSTMIEAMVLASGGHRSPYYAGMIIVFIFLFGLVPISLRPSVYFSVITYLIYLVPILLFDRITDVPIFVNNNVFLLATISGGLVWRFYNHRLLIDNLSLQYDLEKNKKHLELYTHQLEDMVAERTKELSYSNKRHQALFENATDGILVMDKSGVIIDANDKACDMHGFSRESLIGIHSTLLEVEEDRAQAGDRFRRMLGGESLNFETSHFKKDGTRISLEVSARAIHLGDETFIQAFQRDVTEKKKIQDHLFQSQKMDSIGALAGGIAHDFNNLLTVVVGYISTIRKEAGANEKILSKLTVIENAARKATSLTGQLLGFARKKELELLPVNVNDVIKDSMKLLERMVDSQITIDLKLADPLPAIRGDFTKLEQVIMNFIVNARDAMPYGGTIVVATDTVEARPGAPNVPPYVSPGAYVVLSVQDAGVGIPEEIQRKIFEPFFTTKERGKGTGLGLAMVYGVVTEHKGYVTCQSKVGVGTTFTVYLPVPKKEAETVTKREQDAVKRKYDTVLVIDDDDAALAAIKDILEMSGYRVVATTSPMSAMDIFKKMHREIDVVITDMVLPLIDGRELMKQMVSVDPTARFIAVSGFSQFVRRHDDVKPDNYLQKPFESYQLLSLVQKLINEKHSLRKPGIG